MSFFPLTYMFNSILRYVVSNTPGHPTLSNMNQMAIYSTIFFLTGIRSHFSYAINVKDHPIISQAPITDIMEMATVKISCQSS